MKTQIFKVKPQVHTPFARTTYTVGYGNAFVEIPSALGFNNSQGFSLLLNDPTGLNLASGDAGRTPEQVFDSVSSARVNPSATFYVGAPGSSPTPSDSNTGLSLNSPVASITKAIQLANAAAVPSRINIMAGEYVRALGPVGTVPTVDIAFVAFNGRVNTGTFDNFGTFTLDGTFTNCYSLSLTSIDRVSSRLIKTGYYTYGAQTNKDYVKMVDATTLNSTTPTTDDLWATDASKIYIRRIDGAVPTPTNTRLYRSGVSLFTWNTPVNVYLEGIDAEGSNSAATFDYRLTAPTGTTSTFVAKNCSAKYAGGVVNTGSRGFGIESIKGLAYLYGCEGSACASDGLNFHDAQGNGTQCLTVNCSGTDNGRGSSTSNNGHTGHESCIGIDLAGYYPNNRGGSCRWVNSSKVLFAGTYSSDLGDGVGTVAFQTDNTAQMWCDRTKPNFAQGNPAYLDYNASTGTTIRLRNVYANPGTHGGGGTIGTW